MPLFDCPLSCLQSWCKQKESKEGADKKVKVKKVEGKIRGSENTNGERGKHIVNFHRKRRYRAEKVLGERVVIEGRGLENIKIDRRLESLPRKRLPSKTTVSKLNFNQHRKRFLATLISDLKIKLSQSEERK